MKDSQGKTGKETIGAINKEMLLECYTSEDVKKDYLNLRKRLDDPGTDNKEFATLLKLVWEFTVSKPKQSIGLEGDKDININITRGTLDEPRPEPEVSQVHTTGN